jgi:glycogen operon protein
VTQKSIKLLPGSPWPLGATPCDGGINFAVYSEYAQHILLATFEGSNDQIEIDAELPVRTGFIWHGFLPGGNPGLRYGFRAYGPFDPSRGLRFNASKLLLDPYARAISGDITWDDSVYDYQRPQGDHTVRNLTDSCGSVPRSVVVDSEFDWQGIEPPRRSLADTVIYECHVKGATNLHPDIPFELRGSYAGLGHPVMVDHLTSLGVTAVELLPVHHFLDEAFLVEKGLRNYWGYNTIGFFAPMGRYSSVGDGGGQVREFKEMVRSLHSAGIEVFLDVVYNHTAEGGREGATLSFRGLDNSTYYRRPAGRPDDYENFSGTGNTFNTSHPAVVALVMDSLRYWVQEMHVDGFRFDLATSLGRDASNYETWSRLFTAIYQDPVLHRVKLIAEPWDIGPEGYQVGRFPNNWSEWNDHFRDTTRAFWLGHRATLGEFALRLTGSSDLYDRPGRGPLSTINFVTCHDGFDLTDLVSYNQKHNQANGEGNRDGSNDNLGYNFGVEGPSDDPEVLDGRFQARRNLLGTLMLSHGVPMMLGGDELCQTQLGNNNAYCLDNKTTWWDWELDDREREFLEFVRRLIGLRNAYPKLRPFRYVQSESPVPHQPGIVSWRDADGSEMMPGTWGRQDPRALMLTIEPEDRHPGEETDSLLIMFNASNDTRTFRTPKIGKRRRADWRVVLDTAIGDGKSDVTFQGGKDYEVTGCSLVVATSR